MITTINEWKKVNEMNQNEIKLMFFLDSPYKWGPGWTGTPEQHEEMDGIAAGIIVTLDLVDKYNDWNVPEATGTGTILSAYLHPMEYVFRLAENDPETIQKIIKTVKNSTSMTDFVNIKEIKLKTPEGYTTLE